MTRLLIIAQASMLNQLEASLLQTSGACLLGMLLLLHIEVPFASHAFIVQESTIGIVRIVLHPSRVNEVHAARANWA